MMSSSHSSAPASASASPASGVALAPPDATVTTVPYSSLDSGNTNLCNSAVSTYISAVNSWTTWTPANCGKYEYNATIQPSNNTAAPTSSLAITASGIASASLQHTTLNSISTLTEFSSTAITTTITGSAVAETQASHASIQSREFGASGLASLAWILYFGYRLFHRW